MKVETEDKQERKGATETVVVVMEGVVIVLVIVVDVLVVKVV